jgi:hypothetical protein
MLAVPDRAGGGAVTMGCWSIRGPEAAAENGAEEKIPTELVAME